jgi:hypothetical protein
MPQQLIHQCDKAQEQHVMYRTIQIGENDSLPWIMLNTDRPERHQRCAQAVQYCAFCGLRLGSADAATVAVTDAIRNALIDAMAAANLEVDREKWLTADSLRHYLDLEGLDLVQVVITQPWLARRYTPTPQQTS